MAHNEVGARLKSLREAKGWSQDKLAGFSGIGISTIKDLERGKARKPTIATLDQLASALGVPTTELVNVATESASARPSTSAVDAPPRWALQLMSQLERVATTLDRVEQKIERLSLGDDERPDTATPAPVTVAPRVARPYRAASDTSERLTGADLERFLDEQELAERAEEHDPKTEGAEPAV